MTYAARLAALVLTLTWALPAVAQHTIRGMSHMRPMGGQRFLNSLFMPRLIKRYQTEIGLTEAQQGAITQAMEDSHRKMVDLRRQFAAESQKLSTLLEAAPIDAAAALAQAEKKMGVEKEMKTTHLAMLITVNNRLTTEQRAKLRELRPARGRGRRGPPTRHPGPTSPPPRE